MNYTVVEDTIQLKRNCQRVVLSANGVQSAPQYYRDDSHRDIAVELAKKDLAAKVGIKVEDLTGE